MSQDSLCDRIIDNYRWFHNRETRVITFQTYDEEEPLTLLYIAAIVPKISSFASILTSQVPSDALKRDILWSHSSIKSTEWAIKLLFRSTEVKYGSFFTSSFDKEGQRSYDLNYNEHLEKYIQELKDSQGHPPDSGGGPLNLLSTLPGHTPEAIDELQKTCEELKKKCDGLEKKCDGLGNECNSLERKNEELERRVITDLGSSIAEGLHTKIEQLIGDGLSQLTDSNLARPERERVTDTTNTPSKTPGPIQPDNTAWPETIMTPNSSAVSGSDNTITSIPGPDPTLETGLSGTWNKIRSTNKQFEWLSSSGLLEDGRMKRYIHQDLKQLADDINAYLDGKE